MLHSRHSSIRIIGVLLSLGIVSAAHASLTESSLLPEQELEAGWIQLFDGETLFGWHAQDNERWKAINGDLVAYDKDDPTQLQTISDFGDFELKFDVLAVNNADGTVLLRYPIGLSKPPRCCELIVASASTEKSPVGSIHECALSNLKETPTGWHSYHVTVERGRCLVKINEHSVLDYTDPHLIARAAIGLKINKGVIRFRKLRLRPLGLRDLFNGRDLEGWKLHPGQQTDVTVNDAGELHLRHGKGQVESVTQYGDFTLQLTAQLNGRDLNSGIFFRCIPGDLLNGYECQIDNRFKEGDRTRPLDYGTGGIYRQQAVRKVIASDGQWFHLTLIASGKHMSTWVNGYPVCEWTDLRDADDNPRKGCRLHPGTIALQSHDQTTDLFLRAIRVGHLPASSAD